VPEWQVEQLGRAFRCDVQSGGTKVRRVQRYVNVGHALLYGVHNQTVGNGKRGVLERLFFVKTPEGEFARPPRPGVGAFQVRCGNFRRQLRRYAYSTAPVDLDQFVEYYRGRKRAANEKAVETLKVRELTAADAIVDTFIKAELVSVEKDGAPRIIQPRSRRFNCVIGCYIKPIEHDVYKAVNSVWGGTVVAKGLNALARAKVLREHWDDMVDPVAVLMDASRFDQHVSEQALRWEHAVYEGYYPGDRRFRWLLDRTRDNRGYLRAPDGTIAYRQRGGRMSGDMATALGNVLLMCGMTWSLVEHLQIRHQCRFLNDGDDCVLLVERRSVRRVVEAIPGWYLELGFTMKLEGVTDRFEEIDFCQSRPVFDGERWVMCRDPRKALDKDNATVRPFSNQTEWEYLRGSVAGCGLALAGNLPVYCAYYSMLGRGTACRRSTELIRGMDYLAHGMSGKRGEPTPASRASFFAAFGVTPDEQVALETLYDATEPAWAEPVPMGLHQFPHNLLHSQH